MPYSKKTALSQPGFFIPSGLRFSEGESAHRIYTALIGSVGDNMDNSTAKQRAAGTLTSLYRSAVSNRFLFKALRGNDIVWEAIVANATTFHDIETADAKEILGVMGTARKAYAGSTVTELTQLADQYIALVDETAALGPPQTFVVAMATPGPGSPQAVNSLAQTFGDLGVTGAWPPAQFVLRDWIVLADPRVRAALENTQPSVAVLPGSFSPPIDLRIVLCATALQHYESSKAWAMYMTPIGFLDKSLCQAWYEATGRQSKVFGTMGKFLAYAKEALTKRGKTAVVGMLAHWLGNPSAFERIADVTTTDPLERWTHSPHTRRYGTIVILRWVGAKLQMIWYDPWHDCKEIKQQYGASATKIFNYRVSVRKKVKEWADDNGIRIHSRYWGGRNNSAPNEYRTDSVKMSLSILRNLVSSDLEDLPAAGDGVGFGSSGFIRVDED